MYLIADFNAYPQKPKRKGLSTAARIGVGVGLVGLGAGGLAYRKQIGRLFKKPKVFTNPDTPELAAKKAARSALLQKVKPDAALSRGYKSSVKQSVRYGRKYATQRKALIDNLNGGDIKSQIRYVDKTAPLYSKAEQASTKAGMYLDAMNIDNKLKLKPLDSEASLPNDAKGIRATDWNKETGKANLAKVRAWRGFSAPKSAYF